MLIHEDEPVVVLGEDVPAAVVPDDRGRSGGEESFSIVDPSDRGAGRGGGGPGFPPSIMPGEIRDGGLRDSVFEPLDKRAVARTPGRGSRAALRRHGRSKR